MSIFVKATAPARPQSPQVGMAAVLLAAFLIVLALGQLFSYEDFPAVITGLSLPGGETWAHVIAALFVTCEVLAVPFLLRMQLSPAMRMGSMVLGWLAIAGWLAVSLAVNLAPGGVTNAGILGATLTVPPGWWMTTFFVALGVLAGWSAWGMWPLRRHVKHTK